MSKIGFGNLRGDILSALVVSLALIPDAIAFSIIAGVDPMVGIYASFIISIVLAFVGGRPAMISAAAGSTALLMGPLVASHGLQYLLAASILAGFIQILFGVSKLSRLMKFIPRSVMTGFVNALAIMIFIAQLKNFKGEGWIMYLMVAIAMALIYLLPKFIKWIPSTLVAVIVLTIMTLLLGEPVRNVGDMGTLKQTLPTLIFPHIPLNWHTLMIILPYSLSIAMVGTVETLLTATIVDDLTKTESNKNRESTGLGIANILSGLFGGMAGCALIGESAINVKSGGRTRLSTFLSGVFLIILVVLLHPILIRIPMAVLVGIMFVISIGTFEWTSLKRLHKIHLSDAAVMIITVITVLATDNLAIGVVVGVFLTAIFSVAKMSKIQVNSTVSTEHKRKTYRLEGPLFFASTTDFEKHFDFDEDVKEVHIDLSKSKIWDDSAIGSLEKIVNKYKENGVTVKVYDSEGQKMGSMKEA